MKRDNFKNIWTIGDTFLKTPLWTIFMKRNALLQRTLKNYALWKIISKCVKFGTKSTHFEKKNQSALIWGILHVRVNHSKKDKL